MNRARIIGVGAFAPKRILTNRELEKMVETSDDWIVQRTGIRERHIVDEGEGPSDLAIRAAQRGEPLHLRGDGSARKHYIYVSDVVEAYLALAKHASDVGVIGRAFNCSPASQPPSVLEWVQTINAVALEMGLDAPAGLKPWLTAMRSRPSWQKVFGAPAA